MITPAIKEKILSIVSVFETSRKLPKYDALVAAKDGPGGIRQISYGKHQATEYSGSLKGIIRIYITREGRYAKEFQGYVNNIGIKPLWDNSTFKNLLILAATDPIMQQVQNEYFDRNYWNPAYKFFTGEGFTLPLSMLVIYDSYIQSGGMLKKLRDRFAEPTPANGGQEKEWIESYTQVRDKFLEFNPNPVVRGSDYRSDAILDCIAKDNWQLQLPVVVKFNSSDPGKWITVD